MAKDGLKHGTWVLICDGGKALLVQNAGDENTPNLAVRESFEHSDRPTRELGTDRPGRAFASMGPRRSATEQTDLHERAEEDFLKNIAAKVDKNVSEHRIANLVVVAPPRVTGILRRLYSPAVRRAVRHEIEKDYVRMPIREMERHLAQQLDVRLV